MTPVQMITFAVFVVFYVPCLATMLVIRKEMGRKAMWHIVGLTILVATLAGLVARAISAIFY
jgi:ferrous iron transport protein B